MFYTWSESTAIRTASKVATEGSESCKKKGQCQRKKVRLSNIFEMGPSVSSVPILISSSTATNFFVVPQDREGTIGKKRFIAISVLVRSDQNLLSRNTRIQKE